MMCPAGSVFSFPGGTCARRRCGTRVLLASVALATLAAELLALPRGADAFAVPRGRRALSQPILSHSFRPGAGAGGAPPAIIGGGPVSGALAYPFLCAFNHAMQGFVCGCTVLAPDVAMTAAHCVPAKEDLDLWTVHTFRTNATLTPQEDGAIVYQVTDYEVHPEFNSSTSASDVALLLLGPPNNYGTNVPEFVSLNRDPLVPASGELLRAVGWGVSDIYEYITNWGYHSPGYVFPNLLQQVDIPAVSDVECEAFYSGYFSENRFEASFLCAGARGKGICYGDSGSSLLKDNGGGQWLQVGIVSFILGGCNHPEAYLQVYTRTSEVLPWIEMVLALQNGTLTKTTSITRTTTTSTSRTTKTPVPFPTPTVDPSRIRVCNEERREILDGEPFDSFLNLTGIGPIADLDVELAIDHTYFSDIYVYLSAVNDTGEMAVTLMDQPHCYSDARPSGLPMTFDDDAADAFGYMERCTDTRYRPSAGTLAGFADFGRYDNADGSWMLTVSDVARGDSGTLHRWCLVMLPRSAMTTTGPTPTSTPCNGLVTVTTTSISTETILSTLTSVTTVSTTLTSVTSVPTTVTTSVTVQEPPVTSTVTSVSLQPTTFTSWSTVMQPTTIFVTTVSVSMRPTTTTKTVWSKTTTLSKCTKTVVSTKCTRTSTVTKCTRTISKTVTKSSTLTKCTKTVTVKA
ncbi:trypsin-like cysteine/serine peptidase domain-containing protein [Hyaloraphidium curvatum]|nr:trypsin-like cysteine/serine peptidase domain-containing protein [Hyaloraphidium curvatum]